MGHKIFDKTLNGSDVYVKITRKICLTEVSFVKFEWKYLNANKVLVI